MSLCHFGEILTAVTVPSHNPACQNAKSAGCSCTICYGVLHQNDILKKVVDPNAHWGMNTNSAQTTIASLLTSIYRTRFNTLGDPPNSQRNEKCRRRWKNYPHPNGISQLSHDQLERGMQSQVEQRLVDVTLHDLLYFTSNAVTLGKVSGFWLNFVDDLTCNAHNAIPSMKPANSVVKDTTSGYFWASMLALFANVLASSNFPSILPQSFSFTQVIPSQFKVACYPRGKKSRIKNIVAMNNALVINKSSAEIIKAWNVSNLPMNERKFILYLTGATVSADLWRHPAAVKYLLLPAIDSARLLFGQQFSLDPASKNNRVDLEIEDRLGKNWGVSGYW